MFSLGPDKATRELLVNCNPEELYMSHYLGVNPKYGLFCSPLRKDNNPTCSFYRDNKGRLIFKDFGEGFHGDFIAVVQKIYGKSYIEALNIIANDFNIIKRPDLLKNEAKVNYDNSKIDSENKTIIQCQVKEWTKQELDWWLTFGISEKTLKLFKVNSIDSVFLNGEIFTFSTKNNPIYGYYFGKLEGVEQWKIYFPKKTSHRFLLNTSALQGVKQLPKFGEVVVVTKSMKDVMTLYELGIPAIAPQAETVILTSRQFNALAERFRYIIVNGDWDPAGRSFMNRSRKEFPCICLSFTDKEYYGKDISDFVKKFGISKAKELITDLKRKLIKGYFNYHLEYSDKYAMFAE